MHCDMRFSVIKILVNALPCILHGVGIAVSVSTNLAFTCIIVLPYNGLKCCEIVSFHKIMLTFYIFFKRFCFFQFVNSTRIHNNIIRVCIPNSSWSVCPNIKDRYLLNVIPNLNGIVNQLLKKMALVQDL